MRTCFEATIFALEVSADVISRGEAHAFNPDQPIGWDGIKDLKDKGASHLRIQAGFNILHGDADLRKLSTPDNAVYESLFIRNKTIFYKVIDPEKPPY